MEDAYVLQLSDKKFNDFYLCFCGYSKCQPLHNFGPAVRTNYIIHYVLDGKGKYYVNNKPYEIKKGQGFVIEPNVQTFYQADPEQPWSYIWIGFYGTHAHKYLYDIGINSNNLIFHCDKTTELKSIIIEMLKHNTSSLKNEYLLQGLLYQFFSYLMLDVTMVRNKNNNLKESKNNQYVRKAIEFIQNNYANGIKVIDIANYISINRSYLYTLFQENLGISPQEYLTNFRITRATELLTLTDISIESVAISCGYKDPLVFSKKFKEKFKTTPLKYRKSNRNATKEKLNCINNLNHI